MNKLSIVFVGTGGFGVETLESLASDNRFNILSVITGEDKEKGRGLEKSYSDIKACAIKNKLIIQQPKVLAEIKEKLIELKPDFLLVVSFGQIIKKDILEIPKIGTVNIHASLLPKYRGASPIQEAILNKETSTGITWMLMNEKMDEGAVITQKTLQISDEDTYETLSEKLAELSKKYTGETLLNFSMSKTSTPQENVKAIYCKKIKKDDGFIDLKKESAQQIIRKIRAYNIWPGCYIIWGKKRLKIIKVVSVEQKISSGKIELLDKRSFIIGTKTNAIKPLIVQPESKRKMTAEEFLRGQKTLPSFIA